MSKQFVIGIFDDDEILINGVRSVRAAGLKIKNVFSPFPVHGLDNAMGLKRTRISICSFIYGCCGLILITLLTWYTMIHDWPMDIGGKPSFAWYKNMPAFIPVTFESVVLCAAHGMVITFFLRSKLLPGVVPYVPDLRMTDDKFVLLMEAKDAAQAVDLKAMLLKSGASEVK
jgi:hypothetical protein